MENWVTKIATNDAMPSGSMSLIELLLYVLCYIFLYIVLLKCLIKTPEEKKPLKVNKFTIVTNKPRSNEQNPETKSNQNHKSETESSKNGRLKER